MKKFQWYLQEEQAQDSMCYDSGTQICSYGTKNNYVNVVIRGYVNVDYKGERYWHASEMPEELLLMFRNKNAYKCDNENQVFTNENNWYAIEWIKDGDCVESDVFDIGTPATKQEMKELCKEALEEWQDNDLCADNSIG